jgi:hypothetical protein
MTADRVLHCTMQHPVHELYRCLSYLAASHPWTHPVMMAVAERHQPLVDAFHVTYSPEFWEMHELRATDARKSLEDLETLALGLAPHQDFRNWIGKLAHRGLFQA